MNEQLKYTQQNTLVIQDKGIVYECDSEKEAEGLTRACNKFIAENKRDHKTYDELITFKP